MTGKPELPPGTVSAMPARPTKATAPRHVDRRRLGEAMSPWGGDFAYGRGTGAVGAVGSFYFSGKVYPEKELVEVAAAELERCAPLAKAGAHGWTKKDARELRTMAAGLRYYLKHDYEGGSR
jgi:hypothetical protein